MLRRRALIAAGFAAPSMTRAQGGWPARPLRVICAYGAGGAADTVSRILFARLAERTGWTITIENRPGAAGTVAAGAVARAAPDGYTFLYDATAFSVNPSLFGARLPYDWQRDFSPVFLSMQAPNTILSNNDFAPRTVRQLIDAAKAAPGQIDGGSSGIGSAQHITLALFNSMADVRINHVVYREAAATRTDLLGGRIQLQFSNVPNSVSVRRSGAARILGQSAPARVAVMPEVEAIAETLPGFETWEWNGVFAPTGTPPEIIARLNAELNATIAEAAVIERLEGLGVSAPRNSVEEFSSFLSGQVALHTRVVREADIRIE